MNTLVIFIPESCVKCSLRYLATFEVSETQNCDPTWVQLIFFTQMCYLFQALDNEAGEIICASVWTFYLFDWDVIPMFSNFSFHPYIPYLPFTLLLLYNFSDRHHCPLQLLLYFQHSICFGKQPDKAALLHIVPWLIVQGKGFIPLLLIYSLHTDESMCLGVSMDRRAPRTHPLKGKSQVKIKMQQTLYDLWACFLYNKCFQHWKFRCFLCCSRLWRWSKAALGRPWWDRCILHAICQCVTSP